MRQHLSSTRASAGKSKVYTVGSVITAGKTYRPTTDKIPTAGKGAKAGTAYTNYLKLLPAGVNSPSAVGAAGPVGLVPSQIRKAYGLPGVAFGSVVGDGTGQTIAIVDAYDDPNIAGDLAAFDAATGLPAPPSFTKVNQTGGTSSYPVPNAGWIGEIALDVEWAHAMAPNASIVLVEADDNSFTNLVLTAAAYAATIPGVSVVSMSFGADGGFDGESTIDDAFVTPANHAGVTFFASTGDAGAVLPSGGTTKAGGYPSESVNVVAVGGTHLNRADSTGTYASESGWSGSGGGISNFESKPSYQSTVTQSATFRTTPDVSIDADPASGVAVYDSYNNTSGGGWNNYLTGGTSLSSPLWAGLVAVTNQGRVLEGLSTLNGVTQTLPRIYQLPTSVYHDVTTGNNGYAAGAGYDLVTGRGSPIANTLLAALAGGNASGTAFVDRNGDGVNNGTDTTLAGVTVYVDVDGSGTLTTGDLSTTSSSTGAFAFADVVGGLAIREVLPAGYVSTTSGLAGTTAYGSLTGLSLGNFPITFAAPTGTNAYTVRLDSTGTIEQIFQNVATTATPTYSVAKSLLTTLSFTGNTGNDTLTLDLSNGNPLLSGGINFVGGGQTTADAVSVLGALGGSSVTFGSGVVTIGGMNLTYGGVESLAFTGKAGNDAVSVTSNTLAFTFAGGGGSDALAITGGTFTPTADLNAGGSSVTLTRTGGTTTFATGQHLAALTLNSGATAAFTNAGTVLRTSALSIDTGSNSALDLGTAGLVYDYATSSPAAALAALLKLGYAGGAWTGLGVRSSAAAADATRAHAVGYGEASATLGLSGTATASFLGETVDATTLLARYTYYGDANLTGSVDVSDLGALATNYGASSGQTWATGDFNFDALIDVADLGLLATNYGKSIA